MKQTPFSAYRGEDKYIFISYAHKDMGNVFPAIKALHERGYRIWYDEGIEVGEDWSESIAAHLEKAAVVLYFMSRNTAGRENIDRELACSEKNSIPVLTVTMGKFRHKQKTAAAEQTKEDNCNCSGRVNVYCGSGSGVEICRQKH